MTQIFGGHGRNGRIWLPGQAVQLWFWRSVVTWSRVSKWPSSQCCRWMQWHLHLVVAAQFLWHLPSMGVFCLGNRKSLGLQQRRLWSQSSCPSRVHRSLSMYVHGCGRFYSGHSISGSPLQCPSQNRRQQAWWKCWLLRFPFSSPCHWMDQAKWSPCHCLCQDIHRSDQLCLGTSFRAVEWCRHACTWTSQVLRQHRANFAPVFSSRRLVYSVLCAPALSKRHHPTESDLPRCLAKGSGFEGIVPERRTGWNRLNVKEFSE